MRTKKNPLFPEGFWGLEVVGATRFLAVGEPACGGELVTPDARARSGHPNPLFPEGFWGLEVVGATRFLAVGEPACGGVLVAPDARARSGHPKSRPSAKSGRYPYPEKWSSFLDAARKYYQR